MVLPFLAAEVCWLVLKTRRLRIRMIAYLVCTGIILSLGSWLTALAYSAISIAHVEVSTALRRLTSSPGQLLKLPQVRSPCCA